MFASQIVKLELLFFWDSVLLGFLDSFHKGIRKFLVGVLVERRNEFCVFKLVLRRTACVVVDVTTILVF